MVCNYSFTTSPPSGQKPCQNNYHLTCYLLFHLESINMNLCLYPIIAIDIEGLTKKVITWNEIQENLTKRTHDQEFQIMNFLLNIYTFHEERIDRQSLSSLFATFLRASSSAITCFTTQIGCNAFDEFGNTICIAWAKLFITQIWSKTGEAFKSNIGIDKQKESGRGKKVPWGKKTFHVTTQQ